MGSERPHAIKEAGLRMAMPACPCCAARPSTRPRMVRTSTAAAIAACAWHKKSGGSHRYGELGRSEAQLPLQRGPVTHQRRCREALGAACSTRARPAAPAVRNADALAAVELWPKLLLASRPSTKAARRSAWVSSSTRLTSSAALRASTHEHETVNIPYTPYGTRGRTTSRVRG